MSRIPDFSNLAFAPATIETGALDSEDWLTAEAIAVKPIYRAKDLEGLDWLDTYPGFAPYLRGPYPTMYALRPWTIRQYSGFSTAEESQRILSPQSRRRAKGPLGGFRSSHPSRL